MSHPEGLRRVLWDGDGANMLTSPEVPVKTGWSSRVALHRLCVELESLEVGTGSQAHLDFPGTHIILFWAVKCKSIHQGRVGCPYMGNLKRNTTNELTSTHRLREWNYGCGRGEEDGGRDDWEFGMDTYTLLHVKWITNKDLLHSTRASAQCYVAAWMGGEFGGK